MKPAVALPQSLKQVAVEEIRRRIFARELAAGSRIEQEALAEQIGMSKIPVREAISALVAEGLVEVFPRRGAFVVSLSRQDIEDHYWMLARISGHAAARAAAVVSDATLAQLETTLDALQATDDDDERARLAASFHAIINQAAGSRRMNSVLRTLGSPIPLDFYDSNPDAHAHDEHRALLDALIAHDPDRARAAMDAHFENGAAEAIAALERSGFWADGDEAS
ncbi:GntR family transcriptional regulator [Gordonia sp. X0973]|uniref:GntR family transcriptional regulator n=1 Tax=Gordonia sp. X0973 TaxID=2742602 RepID=UPI0013EDC54A|nr:GntR family transcriptional regulator [Gordonia sp. X0973]QKT06505.1 GntR family transcriptional regulator [Gordonia sp. X0973]